ncbi:MAG: alpha/beta hydrolase, partial [Acidobacteria bacterium]
TLIINGKQDKVVPVDVAWRFSRLIENSWLYLIPHCGHWAMIERPDEFCALTSWFLMHA